MERAEIIAPYMNTQSSIYAINEKFYSFHLVVEYPFLPDKMDSSMRHALFVKMIAMSAIYSGLWVVDDILVLR